jgi:hypothetical protein
VKVFPALPDQPSFLGLGKLQSRQVGFVFGPAKMNKEEILKCLINEMLKEACFVERQVETGRAGDPEYSGEAIYRCNENRFPVCRFTCRRHAGRRRSLHSLVMTIPLLLQAFTSKQDEQGWEPDHSSNFHLHLDTILTLFESLDVTVRSLVL